MPLQHRTPHNSHTAGPEPSSATAGRVLCVVDSGPTAEAIGSWLATSGCNFDAAEVMLLSLIPKPEVVRTRGLFIETVRRHLRETGEARLAPLRAALDVAGISHVDRFELADDAETVNRIAQETSSDLIVIAAAAPTPAQRRWVTMTGISMPSLVTRVTELAVCPVLVLKHRCH